MLLCMAGEITIGALVASIVQVSISSAIPAAILAIILAVAGTITTMSASSAQGDVGDGGKGSRFEHPGHHRIARQCLKCEWFHEFGGLPCHDDANISAGLRQFAGKVCRFISRDTAANTENDSLVFNISVSFKKISSYQATRSMSFA